MGDLGFAGVGSRRAVKARDAQTVIKQLVRALYAAQDYYAHGNTKLGHNALVGAMTTCSILRPLLPGSAYRDGRSALLFVWDAISKLVRETTGDAAEDNAYVVRETRRIIYSMLPSRWREMV